MARRNVTLPIVIDIMSLYLFTLIYFSPKVKYFLLTSSKKEIISVSYLPSLPIPGRTIKPARFFCSPVVQGFRSNFTRLTFSKSTTPQPARLPWLFQ